MCSSDLDAQELIKWLKSGAKAKQLFVVHGEKSSADSFAQKVERELHWNVVIPSIDTPFTI